MESKAEGVHERPFAGQTALVTGGAKRLGRVLCRRLAAVGANVAVHYKDSEAQALSLVAQLHSLGVRAAAVAADLSRPAQAEELLARASKAVGHPVSMVVNSASQFPATTLEGLTWDDLAANMAVDAWAPLAITRAFAKERTQFGSVVNLLDTRVTQADWEHMGYHLSKSLLADVTRLCAARFGPKVRVNGVAPGAVIPPDGFSDADRDAVMTRAAHAAPLQSNPTPDDIADAVLYLLGARSVTGQVLFVDGGRHLVRSMA
ncbi:MAG: SDR family oxidoreductase [Thermoplasmatota archaeon]